MDDLQCDFMSFSTVFQLYQDDGVEDDNERLCGMEPIYVDINKGDK